MLGEISKNVNGLSIRVSDQKLCLSKVGLPFLDSSNFTPNFECFLEPLVLVVDAKFHILKCIPNPKPNSGYLRSFLAL